MFILWNIKFSIWFKLLPYNYIVCLAFNTKNIKHMINLCEGFIQFNNEAMETF